MRLSVKYHTYNNIIGIKYYRWSTLEFNVLYDALIMIKFIIY